MRNNRVRDKTASAVFLSTMVERSVTISVLLLHLVVLAIGAYLATKGPQITVGTFVTLRVRLGVSVQNIAHLMHFIPVLFCGSSPRRPCATFRNCWMSRPAAPIAQPARAAAHHQRHQLRTRLVQV